MPTGNDGSTFETEFRPAEGPRESAEAAIEREYEYDDESDTVVAATTGAEFAWEAWARRRAQIAASDHLVEVLGDDWIDQGIHPGSPTHLAEYVAGELDLDFGAFENSDGHGLLVHHLTTLSRDGNVVDEPEVAFETVVEQVPYAIDMTFELHEGTYYVEFPVVCLRGAEQLDEG